MWYARALFAALLVMALSCGDNVVQTPPGGGDDGTTTKGDGKADAWDARNDPERLADFVGRELEYKLESLPLNGRAANTPWTDTYWPTYADSTNVRWQGRGTMSPAEKYDQAFNDWTPPAGFMDLKPFDPENCTASWDRDYYSKLGPAAKWMSDNKGNKRSRDGVDSDGDGQSDECDSTSNDGVEFWWGLCHAWVPASLNEPEPLHPATHNGVTFEVSDIKALLMTVYDRSRSLILGGRCNTKEVERDETGRITDPECRDTNAGSFHVILSNFLGRYGMALAEDRTYNYEVWNQPILGFDVDSVQTIDAARANELLGQSGTEYAFNSDARQFAEVSARVSYVTEASASTRPLNPEIATYTRVDAYHYILELDGNGKIIGGEWINSATSNPHGSSDRPDFLWYSTGPALGSGANPYVDYTKVKQLLELSRAAVEEPGGGGTTPDGEFEKFSSPGKSIPDNNRTGITDSFVLDDTRTISKVSVQVDITHPYIGDLTVKLYKGTSLAATIHDKAGGGADNLNATVEVPSLAGKQLKGTWKVKVVDSAAQDVGTLNRWGIIASAQ